MFICLILYGADLAPVAYYNLKAEHKTRVYQIMEEIIEVIKEAPKKRVNKLHNFIETQLVLPKLIPDLTKIVAEYMQEAYSVADLLELLERLEVMNPVVKNTQKKQQRCIIQ